jgi:ribosomal protein S18 acetylase RimI-like enzyme
MSISNLLIRSLTPGDIPQCERILRGLPEWFGIEDALVRYVQDIGALPAYVAVHGREVLGFLALRHHNPEASEIHVLAVRRDYHKRGIGCALIRHVEAELAGSVKLLQVKTLGPSKPDPGYEKTRAFYLSMGFNPLEETAAFWGEQQPTLIMVKGLHRGD